MGFGKRPNVDDDLNKLTIINIITFGAVIIYICSICGIAYSWIYYANYAGWLFDGLLMYYSVIIFFIFTVFLIIIFTIRSGVLSARMGYARKYASEHSDKYLLCDKCNGSGENIERHWVEGEWETVPNPHYQYSSSSYTSQPETITRFNRDKAHWKSKVRKCSPCNGVGYFYKNSNGNYVITNADAILAIKKAEMESKNKEIIDTESEV